MSKARIITPAIAVSSFIDKWFVAIEKERRSVKWISLEKRDLEYEQVFVAWRKHAMQILHAFRGEIAINSRILFQDGAIEQKFNRSMLRIGNEIFVVLYDKKMSWACDHFTTGQKIQDQRKTYTGASFSSRDDAAEFATQKVLSILNSN